MRYFLCLALLAGCAPDTFTGGPHPGAKPGSDGGVVGTDHDMDTTALPAACGMQTFPVGLSQAEPNVMLVVDKSGSMKETLPGNTQTKWSELKSSLISLLNSYDGKVRWGISIFPHFAPSAGKCDVGQVDIPVGPGTEMQIINLITPITDAQVSGATPTATTLDNLMKTGGLNDPTRANYILLMTDGLPTCGQDGQVTPVIDQLYALAPSVRTFVVGIGSETQSNPQQLNDWATAGHTARMNSTTLYYQANNINDLQSAFAEIASGIASCTYQLNMKPQDPNLLVATIDGKAVASDPANGTTYDASSQSITFHGASCTSIKMGGAKKVDLIYGCPPPPIS